MRTELMRVLFFSLFLTFFTSQSLSASSNSSVDAPLCNTGFQWANNAEGSPPCTIAALADQLCTQTPTYTIDPILPGNHYSPPNKTLGSASVCTCSWAVYNLMSMCTACQGSTSSVTWEMYKEDCEGLLTDSNTYFPSDLTLPENNNFPVYAQANPEDWDGAIFSVTQALSMVQSNETTPPSISTSVSTSPSLTPTSTSSTNVSTQTNSTPTAAIVGGTLGGVVLLACVAGALVWWYHHRKRSGFHTLQSPRRNSDYFLIPSGKPDGHYILRASNASPMPTDSSGPGFITPFYGRSPQSSVDHSTSTNRSDVRAAKIASMISWRSGITDRPISMSPPIQEEPETQMVQDPSPSRRSTLKTASVGTLSRSTSGNALSSESFSSHHHPTSLTAGARLVSQATELEAVLEAGTGAAPGRFSSPPPYSSEQDLTERLRPRDRC